MSIACVDTSVLTAIAFDEPGALAHARNRLRNRHRGALADERSAVQPSSRNGERPDQSGVSRMRIAPSKAPSLQYQVGRSKLMDWKDHITVDPEICHGRAYITGTRVLVSTVLDNRADGLDSEEVMRSYPSVTRKSLQAAVRYAAQLAGS